MAIEVTSEMIHSLLKNGTAKLKGPFDVLLLDAPDHECEFPGYRRASTVSVRQEGYGLLYSQVSFQPTGPKMKRRWPFFWRWKEVDIRIFGYQVWKDWELMWSEEMNYILNPYDTLRIEPKWELS